MRHLLGYWPESGVEVDLKTARLSSSYEAMAYATPGLLR
jgi:hypothetical protein